MATGSSKGSFGISFMLVLITLVTGCASIAASNCAFPAIYSFGDSTADTGAWSAAIELVPSPNGMTYFKHPAGRLSDGRVILDFIAEHFGLPFLSAYLDSIGTNFQHGANFAFISATILPEPERPIDLQTQMNQFLQFKSRVSALYNCSESNSNMPNPQDFPLALYIFDMGHNDLALAFFRNSTEEQVIPVIPGILDPLAEAIKKLYDESARAFLVYNMPPIGCNPFGAEYYPPKNATFDKNNCVASQNDVAQEYNRQLKDRIVQLRQQLFEATITYVDVYTNKYSLIDNANKEGFGDPGNFCCGQLSPIPVFCGLQTHINGTDYYGSACSDPSKFIYWDGVHFSDAANQILVQNIIDGSLSDPAIPIDQACPWAS